MIVVKVIKIKITAKFCAFQDTFLLKIQRELCHPKYAQKVETFKKQAPGFKSSSDLNFSGLPMFNLNTVVLKMF